MILILWPPLLLSLALLFWCSDFNCISAPLGLESMILLTFLGLSLLDVLFFLSLPNLNYLLKFIITLLHIPLISLTSHVIGTTSVLLKPSLLLTSRQHSCSWVWLEKNTQVSLTGLTLRV